VSGWVCLCRFVSKLRLSTVHPATLFVICHNVQNGNAFWSPVYVPCEPYIVSLFGLTWLERVIQHPPFRGDLVIAQLFWFASNEIALKRVLRLRYGITVLVLHVNAIFCVPSTSASSSNRLHFFWHFSVTWYIHNIYTIHTYTYIYIYIYICICICICMYICMTRNWGTCVREHSRERIFIFIYLYAPSSSHRFKVIA